MTRALIHELVVELAPILMLFILERSWETWDRRKQRQ